MAWQYGDFVTSPHSGNLTINGTLTVTTLSSAGTVSTGDNCIELNNDVVGAPTEDAGIEINRGGSTAAQLKWNETTDQWEAGVVGSLEAIVTEHDGEQLALQVRNSASTGHYTGGDLSFTPATLNYAWTAGTGVVVDDITGDVVQVAWAGGSSSVLASNPNTFIYVDKTGTIIEALSPPDFSLGILLGRIHVHNGVILYEEQAEISAKTTNAKLASFHRFAVTSIFKPGSTGGQCTENGVRGLDVTGDTYYFGIKQYTFATTTNLSWFDFYSNGAGGWIQGTQSVVDNTTYDDGSGTLASLSPGFYAKHRLYTVSSGATLAFLLQRPSAEYKTLLQAQFAPKAATAPAFTGSVVPICDIIVQEGTANIVDIIDVRPQTNKDPVSLDLLTSISTVYETLSFKNKIDSKSATYTFEASYIFIPTSERGTTMVEAIFAIDVDAASIGNARLYDVNNAQVIAEVTTSVVLDTQNMVSVTALGTLPTTREVLELQIKNDSGTKTKVTNVTFKYE